MPDTYCGMILEDKLEIIEKNLLGMSMASLAALLSSLCPASFLSSIVPSNSPFHSRTVVPRPQHNILEHHQLPFS